MTATKPVRFLTSAEFFAPEPPGACAVPALGIRSGPPTLFIGESYVSKTLAAFSAGLSVALGKPLWGKWAVNQGPWVHLDVEQGRWITRERIQRMARGFGLGDAELQGLIESGVIRLAVFPDVRLTSSNALEVLKAAFTGVRFVTIDSLRTILGHVDENDSAVRGYLNVVTLASDATNASCMVIHHSGKPGEVPRQRRHMGRGSSGITDEAQCNLVATRIGFGHAHVTHEKTRSKDPPVAPFELRVEDIEREGDSRWGLRVTVQDSKDGPSGWARIKTAVEAAGTSGFQGTQAQLRAAVGMGEEPFRAALKEALGSGELVTRTDPRGWQLKTAQ